MMLENYIMIYIVDALHHSKRNLTPIIYLFIKLYGVGFS
jgi:hypothetical protein